jgi:hypothetical protein
MVSRGKEHRATGDQNPTPPKKKKKPPPWGPPRGGGAPPPPPPTGGSLIWFRTPRVALAALVYPRLPSLTTSWSVPNPQKTRMDRRGGTNLNLTLNNANIVLVVGSGSRKDFRTPGK